MKGLDDYITGRYNPNAPFNQVSIEDIWYPVINILPVTDDECEKMLDEPEIEKDFDDAFERVIASKNMDLKKQYAKEISKEFMKIRNSRKFKDELMNEL